MTKVNMFKSAFAHDDRKPARPGPGRAPIAIAASVAAVLALACGYPAPHEDPPGERVPFESVVGTWRGGVYLIDLREDGTYALTSSAPEFAALRDEGTWTLCKDYPYEEYEEEGPIQIECVESGAGEWIAFDHPEIRVFDFPWSLYDYNIDTGVDDDRFYRKVS
jgi:hypothetical protein